MGTEDLRPDREDVVVKYEVPFFDPEDRRNLPEWIPLPLYRTPGSRASLVDYKWYIKRNYPDSTPNPAIDNPPQ